MIDEIQGGIRDEKKGTTPEKEVIPWSFQKTNSCLFLDKAPTHLSNPTTFLMLSFHSICGLSLYWE